MLILESTVNPIVTTIGLIATACTATAAFPQAIKVIRTKDASSVNLPMAFLLCIGQLLWLIYGICLGVEGGGLPMIIGNAVGFGLQCIVIIYKFISMAKARKAKAKKDKE